MRFNLDKCPFGVQVGKFPGFMLTHRGIEANSDKSQEIIDMRSPISINEVQQLTGRLATLSRFLSYVGDKSMHLFATTKKVNMVQMDRKVRKCIYGAEVIPVSPTDLGPSKGEFTTHLISSSIR